MVSSSPVSPVSSLLVPGLHRAGPVWDRSGLGSVLTETPGSRDDLSLALHTSTVIRVNTDINTLTALHSLILAEGKAILLSLLGRENFKEKP